MATQFDQQINEFNALRSPAVVGLDDTNSGDAQFQYVLYLYAWTGAFSAKPGTPQGTFKKPPLSNTNGYFDIAKVAKDYIEHRTDPQNVAEIEPVSGSIVNIALEAGYEASGVDASANNDASGFFGFDGYTEYLDGLNSGISGNVLTDQPSTIAISDVGNELLSFLWDNSNDVSAVTYIGTGGTEYTASITDYLGAKASVTTAGNKAGYIPIGANNLAAFAADLGSTTLDEVLSEGLGTVNIIDSTGGTLESYTIDQRCEPRYDIHTIFFINKYGLWDFLTCFKRANETQERRSSEYRKQASTLSGENLTYNTTVPQYTNYNVNGRGSITLNTDYQDAGITEIVRQIAMSEYILIQKNNETPYPVQFVDNSVPMQKEVNEKLITYSINFRKAFDTVNTMG